MTKSIQKQNIGSVWSKWDLHVHTPASFFWEGGKKLSEMSDDEKEESMKSFLKTVNESDVEVFCIMDYWTFDWCKELIKYKKANPDALDKTVFHGIELRIECSVDYRLNIHVILSDNTTEQELDDFKSALQIRIGEDNRNLSNEALKQFAKALSDDKAKKHGYNPPNELSGIELLELGSKTAEVSRDSLKEALKKIPKGCGFIILPYDTSDGLLDLNWEEHPQDDIFFMQTAHIFESRDQRNIDLLNGEKTEDNKDFFKNFFKTLGEKPKPCVSGSDAHKFAEYGKYPSDKITWVKAKPSFEGLKQILYEPKSGERVCVNNTKPDLKSEDRIIESIQFKGTDKFPPKIEFNENLVSIIGSRSSGKSALLSYIAYGVNQDLAKERREKINEEGPAAGIEWADIDFDVEILWKGGVPQEGNITYIPQSYLNQLSKSPHEITNMIKPIVLKKFPSLQQAYTQYMKSVTTINNSISKSIDEWFEVRDEIKKKELEIRAIGDEKHITKIVERLKKEIEDKQKEADLTSEEISKHEEVTKFIKLSIQRLNELKYEYSSITELYTNPTKGKELDVKNFDMHITWDPKIDKLPDSLRIQINEITKAQTKSIPSKVKKELLSYLKLNLVEQLALILSLHTVYEEYKDLLRKAKATAELQDLIAERGKQEIKLDNIQKSKTLIKVKKKAIEEKVKDIKDNLVKRENENESLQKTFAELDQKNEEINFNIDIDFEIDILSEVLDKINKQETSPYISIDGDSKSLNVQEVRKSPGLLLERLYDGTQKIKAGNVNSEVAKALLKLTESVRFMAKMEGDIIGGFSKSTMTEGKQALFALTLILSEDTDSWPLLIDQPEDDLDSWSIYESIVPFLKDQKKKRQIFMVSHNANLVIGADSEQVLVANQHGDNRKNKDSQLFDYLSGALEDSKPRDKSEELILRSRGIKEHACDILDGGEIAFEKRMNKYNIKE